MTAVKCPECEVMCAGPQGLASHRRSMHRTAEVAPVSGDFAWEDPPKRGAKATLLPEILAVLPRLRERPGQWARVKVYGAKTSAGTARKTLEQSPEVAGVEFSAHRFGDGSALFARWKEAA